VESSASRCDEGGSVCFRPGQALLARSLLLCYLYGGRTDRNSYRVNLLSPIQIPRARPVGPSGIAARGSLFNPVKQGSAAFALLILRARLGITLNPVQPVQVGDRDAPEPEPWRIPRESVVRLSGLNWGVEWGSGLRQRFSVTSNFASR
jgi:hypothetical protein